jgi:hypothetical protein
VNRRACSYGKARASRLGREYRSCHTRERMTLLPLDPRSRSVCRPAPDRPTNRRYCPSRCGRLRPVTGPVVFPQHEQSGNFFLWTQYPLQRHRTPNSLVQSTAATLMALGTSGSPSSGAMGAEELGSSGRPSGRASGKPGSSSKVSKAKGRCVATAALFPGFKILEIKSLRFPQEWLGMCSRRNTGRLI